MAPFSPIALDAIVMPTIIDLRHVHSTEMKQDFRDSYPSPPSDHSHSRLHNQETDASDSDTMDDLTDSSSVTGSSRSTDEFGGDASSLKLEDTRPDDASSSGFDLPAMIIDGLCPADASSPKRITTMVLYDDRGLQLFDEITYLKEYYLTQEEINILDQDSDKIVEHIPDNSVIVELGAGSLRKTVLLLNALERKRKNIRYYALDLMLDELTKSLKSLGSFANVKTAGLWGTYDEGLAFVSSFGPEVPKTLLWLGSSIGNLTRTEALDFITSYRKTLNMGDNWLIGIDRRNDAQEITVAYNDPQGVTREFVMNGLDHINVILAQPFIDRSKFEYFARYNVEEGRHEAYYKVMESHQLVYQDPKTMEETIISLTKDELINVEYSYKWSPAETTKLFDDSEMTKVGQWTSPSSRYDLHLVRKSPFYFKSTKTPTPCPSEAEWVELWKSWDVVTMSMIQHPTMLLEKPIALRHPFLFYLGHIPVFMDTQLSRVLDEPFLEPAYFNVIFERGIDPDVDDPTKCHAHSEVPDTWPEIEAIIDFRDRARERLLRVLSDRETYPMTRRLARVLFMAFEHEAMHLETLIYMLVQSPNTLPPPSVPAPWDSKDLGGPLPQSSSVAEAAWIHIDPATLDKAVLTLGHNDLEGADLDGKKDDLTSPFGWDNEHPLVEAQPGRIPGAFRIQSRQVTNGEFLAYLEATGGHASRMPESWSVKDDGVFVKSVYGLVPMRVARDWPVWCSNLQAQGYATWAQVKAGAHVQYSIPSEHELSIVFKLRQATVPKSGLENYGFRQWYPTLDRVSCSAAEVQANPLVQFSGPGGLWDWTSTAFAPLGEGFVTSRMYPGYSSDFFDEKHMVVLGGSWATHPRLVERRSFRNWFQANYPYVFAGFRLVERV
ncbi:hypothetical protein BG005_011787 [Podila minutissima]|nr:hypothetical protein BG005_011787 [Podila minutissima]